jgi:high-affinity iron transporter
LSPTPYGVRLLEELTRAIRERAEPVTVSRLADRLLSSVIGQGAVETAPTHPPDLEHGRALYSVSCAACHGAAGDPLTVPVAQSMTPFPTSFVDPANINPLSPFRAFLAVRHGIPGTAMPSFASLSKEDRWDVAFFVFALRHPACAAPSRMPPLSELSIATDNHLEALYGDAAMPCLRRLARR